MEAAVTSRKQLRILSILRLNNNVVGYTVINEDKEPATVERITSRDCKIVEVLSITTGEKINVSIAELYNCTMHNGILNGELICKNKHTSESSIFEKLSDFEFKVRKTDSDVLSIVQVKDIHEEEQEDIIDKYFKS